MTVTTLTPVALELDTRGLSCPLPVLKARQAVSKLETGETVRVLATDPGSVQDLASFCRQTGNELLSSREDGDAYEFLIRKC